MRSPSRLVLAALLVPTTMAIVGCDSFLVVRGRLETAPATDMVQDCRVSLHRAEFMEVLASKDVLEAFELESMRFRGRLLITVTCAGAEVYRSPVFQARDLAEARPAESLLDLGTIIIGPSDDRTP